MAEKTLAESIEENAKAPRRASGDEGSMEQHSLIDQIEVDRYLASKAAAKKKGLGLRRLRGIPPGAA